MVGINIVSNYNRVSVEFTLIFFIDYEGDLKCLWCLCWTKNTQSCIRARLT